MNTTTALLLTQFSHAQTQSSTGTPAVGMDRDNNSAFLWWALPLIVLLAIMIPLLMKWSKRPRFNRPKPQIGV